MEPEALINRAGELKQQLVAFSQEARYERPWHRMLSQFGDGTGTWDEDRLLLLWDHFVLEYRLRNGRTVVEQFIGANPDLPPEDQQMVLGWRDVVSGPFEVQRRDGSALILVSLVDDLTYRARSTAGPSVFRHMPRRSFVITRLVAVGDEWVFSGPQSVLPPNERDAAFRMALETSLSTPEAVYRNPENLATAWELQRQERQRFIRFFGSDLVVVPGDQAQSRLDGFHAFSREEARRAAPEGPGPDGPGPATESDPRLLEMPQDLVEAETVALFYDEDDGLAFYAGFGLVEEAFTDPGLVKRRKYRDQVRAYLNDDSVSPAAIRRLADRDPAKASALFRRVLKRRQFDWVHDGDELLRSAKPDYFARTPRPRVSPVSGQLAAYARRR